MGVFYVHVQYYCWHAAISLGISSDQWICNAIICNIFCFNGFSCRNFAGIGENILHQRALQ